MAREGLPAHAVPDIPQLDRGVAGSRHKCAEVGRQGQAHDVAGVAREHRGLLTRLNVPQCTGAQRQRELGEKGRETSVAVTVESVVRASVWSGHHSPCGVS